MVEEFAAGESYEPGDAEEMAAAIERLAADRTRLKEIRDNCIELSRRFDRDAIAERTEKILAAVHQGTPLPEVVW